MPSLVKQCVVGRVVGVGRAGRVLVEYAGAEGPVTARYLAAVRSEQLREAVQRGQSVLLIFEGGESHRPIVIGLLVDDDAQAADALAPLHAVEEDKAASAPAMTEATARVDGKRVHVTAQDEIVFECGEASITLRRNGRVVIRGVYVESRSRGTNRIKGGTVRIN